ncbi:hypothetical protein ACS0TY_004259 [Phlomoides rotata]
MQCWELAFHLFGCESGKQSPKSVGVELFSPKNQKAYPEMGGLKDLYWRSTYSHKLGVILSSDIFYVHLSGT